MKEMRSAKIFCWVVFLSFIFLSVEVLSFLALSLLKDAGYRFQFLSELYPDEKTTLAILHKIERTGSDTGHVMFDPEIGWVLRPDGYGHHKDQMNFYHVNRQGFRGFGSTAPMPGRGVTRIMAFGDSFTFGNELLEKDTWTAVLDATLRNAEVLNSGVPGYGHDQAFLLSERLIPNFHPDIVLLGFQPENTNRNVSVLRAFYTNEHYLPFTKPRFRLQDGRLELLPNPLRSFDEYRKAYEDPSASFPLLGAHDDYYDRHLSDWNILDRFASVRLLRLALLRFVFSKPPVTVDHLFDPKSEAVKLTIAIMDAWYDKVKAAGATPVIVVLPNSPVIDEMRRSGRMTHQAYLDHWAQKGMRVVDPSVSFAADPKGVPNLYLSGGHYSPSGTSLVAESVASYLQDENLIR